MRTRRGVALGLALAAPLVVGSPALAAATSPGSYAAVCRAAQPVLSAARPPQPAVEAVVVPTALPPTPLPIVVRSVRTAVVARVAAVLYQGSRPRAPHRPRNFVGPIPPSRCQVVRLAVRTTVAGTPAGTLVVVKPEAPYLLTVSRHPHPGTFLLDASTPYPVILGNDGPDPYSPAAVAAALTGAGS